MTIAKKAAYTTGFFASFFFLYFTIQFLISQSQINLILEVDKMIPFVPEFVWIYHSLHLQVFLVMVFLIREEHLFFKTFWACALSSILLFTFYLLMPSFYPRPDIDSIGISAQMVNITRIFDAANNTFPSGHVAFTWLMFLAASKSKMVKEQLGFSLIFLLWTLGISLSTLVIKQHHIVDVASGWLLAFVVSYFVERFNVARALSDLFTNKGGVLR